MRRTTDFDFTASQRLHSYLRKLLPGKDPVKEKPDARAACEYLRQAATLNLEDPEREGSLLKFGSVGQLVMTGDLHGHQGNFKKLQRFCAMERSPGRRVILHELIHGEPSVSDGFDLSIDLLIEAAAWKCEFPDNVYSLQSNHELSQLYQHEITKGGRSVIRDFQIGIQHRFGKEADEVLAAANEYMDSLPLAARTANGIFLAHSLPDPMSVEMFDPTIFQRKPTQFDVEPGGSAYSLVWGRFHTPQTIDLLAELLNAQIFIVGHTPQEMGYSVMGRMIIMASEHSHGTFLPINLNRRYTIEELERDIRKFVSVE